MAAFVTIHPSLLLRIEDKADKECEYDALVGGLRRAAACSRKRAAD